MTSNPRPLALVTGASSGIGYHLAEAADYFLAFGAEVETLQTELASCEGIDKLCALLNKRPLSALLANAGQSLGKSFLEQDFEQAQHVIDTNITGTIYLLHQLAPDMVKRGKGRILITGSIAGFVPGPFQAVYNGSKAFLDSFSATLRNELKDLGVTVTCLMPGVTDTEVFARADMLDTRVGAFGHKADPADVAKAGFEAMMRGQAEVVTGLQNKLLVAAAKIMPSQLTAELHRQMAEPGKP